ncbi:putative membrane protein [Ilumatobacter fluminis]|uniref:Putative membrane protein n=1 Tax=Ilumatobacter fluminis TaxID=467091 RepID=A0A4R7I6N2_9ACTN|nr:MauE/DoxX family redox-associated membrane protein [Ilumatobacter fluminis]TDT18443.1 putative membrane protein [Ilumatobacter fluminis]
MTKLLTRETTRSVTRWLLGGALVFAGIGHLTHQREEFQAQVPDWFPVDADLVVLLSGVVEITLGLALVFVSRYRALVGWIAAAFFVVIFPGNIAQWIEGTDAFGLDTDTKRFVRLFFQPVLVAWALFSTGAWRAWRRGGTSAVLTAE